MKKTEEPLFSNGTEFTCWIYRNCERCVKQSHFIDDIKGWSNFRCSIDRDIQLQLAGYDEVNKRSLETVQNNICPYIQTKWKRITKKRLIKGQSTLF
jgi:hypothetical protein